jgi:hypothetical protein
MKCSTPGGPSRRQHGEMARTPPYSLRKTIASQLTYTVS